MSLLKQCTEIHPASTTLVDVLVHRVVHLLQKRHVGFCKNVHFIYTRRERLENEKKQGGAYQKLHSQSLPSWPSPRRTTSKNSAADCTVRCPSTRSGPCRDTPAVRNDDHTRSSNASGVHTLHRCRQSTLRNTARYTRVFGLRVASADWLHRFGGCTLDR